MRFVEWPEDYSPKRIYLHPIGYWNSLEIADKIFIIKKTDDAGQPLKL